MKKTTLYFTLLFVFASAFPFGGNINGITDYDPNSVFVNQVHASRQFGLFNEAWNTAGMTYDANGWPTKDFGVLLVTTTKELPETTGVWYLSWKGQATVSPLGSTCTVVNQTYNAGTNTGSAYVNMPKTEGNLWLNFATSNKGVTNLVAIRPGYPTTNWPTYTNTFLNVLSGLNTIRFMDFTSTNANPVTTWSERTSLTTAQALDRGCAWEHAVDLANALKANMWVNVPHKADDNYVLQLATLIKSRLNSTLAVYVEYSNEVWNSGFVQFSWNLNEAQNMVNNKGWGPVLNYDNVNNIYAWAYRRVALRAKQISDIFRGVWGECAINDRVRVVVAHQMATPYTFETGIDMIDTVYGPPDRWFYAAAGAPYFQMNDINNKDNMTKNDVITSLNKSCIAAPSDYSYTENVAYATFYRMKYVGYEGGPDTFGPHGIQAKKDATLDSRMTPIVIRYLNDWYAAGLDLFNWFNYYATDYNTQYGTWGVTNDMFLKSSPKLNGIKNVTKSALPAITAGHGLPGNFPGSAKAYNYDNSGLWRYMASGDFALYLVRDDHKYGAVYDMYLNYTAAAKAYVTVKVNNIVAGNISLPITKSGAFNITQALPVTIGTGLSGVKLIAVGNGFQVSQVKFSVKQVLSSPIPGNSTCHGTTTTGVIPVSQQANENSSSTLSSGIVMILLLAILSLF